MSISRFLLPLPISNRTLTTSSKVQWDEKWLNTVTEIKHLGSVAFQLLVKYQKEDLNMDLKQLMSYLLSPVHYILGTAVDFSAKTDKSNDFHYLRPWRVLIFHLQMRLLIIDGNATFHAMQQVPPNFRQMCPKLYDKVSPSQTDFSFSTESVL